jgi:hypothetical protein
MEELFQLGRGHVPDMFSRSVGNLCALQFVRSPFLRRRNTLRFLPRISNADAATSKHCNVSASLLLFDNQKVYPGEGCNQIVPPQSPAHEPARINANCEKDRRDRKTTNVEILQELPSVVRHRDPADLSVAVSLRNIQTSKTRSVQSGGRRIGRFDVDIVDTVSTSCQGTTVPHHTSVHEGAKQPAYSIA